MLTSGFTTTSSGWETVSGPTCSAACTSRPLAEPTSTSTYTGHAGQHRDQPAGAQHLHRLLDQRRLHRGQDGGRDGEAGRAACRRAAQARAGGDGGHGATGEQRPQPGRRRGAGVPAARLGGHQEERQRDAHQRRGPPRGAADRPPVGEPPDQQGEHQLGDQHRLHDREPADVEGQRLEAERDHPHRLAEQPPPVAHQVGQQPPAAGLAGAARLESRCRTRFTEVAQADSRASRTAIAPPGGSSGRRRQGPACGRPAAHPSRRRWGTAPSDGIVRVATGIAPRAVPIHPGRMRGGEPDPVSDDQGRVPPPAPCRPREEGS